MKLIDVLFWVLILSGVGLILWHLFGSPDITSTFISVILFFATSELLLKERGNVEMEKNLRIEREKLKMKKR